MDEELQELLLSLHSEGLLEVPSQEKKTSSKKGFTYLILTFSLAIACGTWYASSFFTLPQSTHLLYETTLPLPSRPLSKKKNPCEMWSYNELSHSLPAPSNLTADFHLVNVLEARETALKQLQKNISTQLTARIKNSDPSPKTGTLLNQFDSTNQFFLQEICSLVEKNPEISPSLIEERKLSNLLAYYTHLSSEKEQAEQNFNNQLLEIEASSSISELFQKTASFLHSFDKHECHTQLLKSCTVAIESISSTCFPCHNNVEEHQNLWKLSALIPDLIKNITQLETVLTSSKIAFFDTENRLNDDDKPITSSTVVFPSEYIS